MVKLLNTKTVLGSKMVLSQIDDHVFLDRELHFVVIFMISLDLDLG